MGNYDSLYLVKIPMAFLVRSCDEHKVTAAYSVLDTMSEAAFEEGENIAFGEVKIEKIF